MTEDEKKELEKLEKELRKGCGYGCLFFLFVLFDIYIVFKWWNLTDFLWFILCAVIVYDICDNLFKDKQ